MDCRLEKKVRLSESLFDFTIDCPEMAQNAKAGQFLHILCGGDAYLRRPISICSIKDKRYLRFIFQVKGKGTKALSEKKEGDILDVLGPLGNGFEITESDEKVIIVGGGIGTFPLLQLTAELGKKAVVVLGFKSEADIVLENEFSAYTNAIFIATEDGSCGYKGYVTDLLNNILQANKVNRVYVCGPMPMMKAAAEVTKKYGVATQVSLEERMGCGIGACVTCAVTVGGAKKRVCKDGPVFNAAEVEWNG